MTTVLLVWEEVPEATKFYRLEGADAEIALAAHGCFVNMVDGDPEEHAERLSLLLEDKTPMENVFPVDLSGYDKLVVSGFLL